MIPVVTCEEMKSLDLAIKADQSFHYMQKAARGLFDIIINRYLEFQKQNQNTYITIFAGKGNNGGDGILLAAYLAEEGYPVTCFIVGTRASLKNEALQAYIKLESLNNGHEYINFIQDHDDLVLIDGHFQNISPNYDQHFFVDALLGIGAKGEPQELYASVINLINNNFNKVTIFAVDAPSGSDNDTGAVSRNTVRAHNTITMGFPKLGSFFYPARAHYGLTMINNLDYPSELIQKYFQHKMFFVNSVTELIPPRIINGSKYDHGVGALIAGSPGMSGAAALSAKAAYRVGLGLLCLLSDEETLKQISPSILEAITQNENLCNQIINDKHVGVLAIGPGLSLAKSKLVRNLVSELNLPIILDADAIHAFTGSLDLLENYSGDLLLTPHAGEYQKLTGDSLIGLKPLDIVQALTARAKDLGASILYKGSPTIIADPSGQVFIVPWGNSALAKAGTGDVLTGMILGIAAQIYTIKKKSPESRFFYEEANISPLTQAAILAAFIHGRAAEFAAKDLSEYSLLASDLLDYISKVFLQLL